MGAIKADMHSEAALAAEALAQCLSVTQTEASSATQIESAVKWLAAAQSSKAVLRLKSVFTAAAHPQVCLHCTSLIVAE